MLNLLSSAYIFGPNGSGKTNLLLALETIKMLAKYRCEDELDLNKYKKEQLLNYISSKSDPEDKVCKFTLIFDFGRVFTYDITYDSADNSVLTEELNEVLEKSQRKILKKIDRTLETYTSGMTEYFDLGGEFEDENGSPSYSLISYGEIPDCYYGIIPTMDSDTSDILEKIFRDIESYRLIFYDDSFIMDENSRIVGMNLPETAVCVSSIPVISRQLESILDTGITLIPKSDNSERSEYAMGHFAFDGNDLLFTTYDEQYIVRFTHTFERHTFTLLQESTGVIQILLLLIKLSALRDNDMEDILVGIDEMGLSLNPRIMIKLMQLIRNEYKDTQFIFTMHETELMAMDFLRADQIWFMQKNDGISSLYRLTQFKDYEEGQMRTNYLDGRLGAIPYFTRRS